MMNKVLYKTRKDKKIQFWYAEREDNRVRAISGLWEDGNPVESSIVTSEWKEIEATNVGRSNERDPIEQAIFEYNKMYREQLESGYADEIGKKTLPNKVDPMLAEKFKAGVNYTGWYSQPKLDGVRCIVNSSGMWSRNGKPILSAPHVYETLKHLTDQGYVFDGELYNHDLKHDFNKIISLARKSKPTSDDLIESKEKIQYHIYDMVDDATFKNRTLQLENLVVDTSSIKKVRTFLIDSNEEMDKIYGQYLEDGYEGQMLRKADSLYEFTRTKSLLKRKEFMDEEFSVTDIVCGEGNWKDYAKVVHCVTKDGKPFKATLKGDQEYCLMVLKTKELYTEATVRFQNYTPDGIPRFPICVILHVGKREL